MYVGWRSGCSSGQKHPECVRVVHFELWIGGWIGQIADEDLPAEMQVDYVRWYQPINNY